MACIAQSLIEVGGSNQYSFTAYPKQKRDYKNGGLNGCKTIMPTHAKVETALARLCSDMPYSKSIWPGFRCSFPGITCFLVSNWVVSAAEWEISEQTDVTEIELNTGLDDLGELRCTE